MYSHEVFQTVSFYQNNPYMSSVPQSQQVQNQIYFVLFTNNLIGLLMSELIFDNESCKVIKRFPSLKKLDQVLPSPSNMSFCLNFMWSKLNFFLSPLWCHPFFQPIKPDLLMSPLAYLFIFNIKTVTICNKYNFFDAALNKVSHFQLHNSVPSESLVA